MRKSGIVTLLAVLGAVSLAACGSVKGYPPYEVVVSYTRWITPIVGPD